MIDALESLAADYGDEAQVLVAIQPNYPLALNLTCAVGTRVHGSTIVGSTVDAEMCASPNCERDATIYSGEHDDFFCDKHAEENGLDACDDDAQPVVWLIADGHPDDYGDNAWTSPYASSALWDESVGESYAL
jgi:hypothetical protein